MFCDNKSRAHRCDIWEKSLKVDRGSRIRQIRDEECRPDLKSGYHNLLTDILRTHEQSVFLRRLCLCVCRESWHKKLVMIFGFVMPATVYSHQLKMLLGFSSLNDSQCRAHRWGIMMRSLFESFVVVSKYIQTYFWLLSSFVIDELLI